MNTWLLDLRYAVNASLRQAIVFRFICQRAKIYDPIVLGLEWLGGFDKRIDLGEVFFQVWEVFRDRYFEVVFTLTIWKVNLFWTGPRTKFIETFV